MWFTHAHAACIITRHGLMSETPDLRKIEQVLKRMTLQQFSALCAELGLLEEALGNTRAEQMQALIDSQRGNPNRLVRAIRHVWPTAFDAPPPRLKREIKIQVGPIIGGIALLVIVAVGVVIVINAVNPSSGAPIDFRVTASPVATQGFIIGLRTPTQTATPTPTPTPTNTPTPNLNATLTATYAPTKTPTRTPTRTPRSTATGGVRTPTTPPTVAPTLAAIYPRVLLSKPASNSTVDSRVLSQMRWFVPGINGLGPDERYRLHVWQGQKVVFEELTSNNWHDWFGGPNGQVGTYQWSVAAVRVDASGKVIGVISPESDQWTVTWK